nr:MULTISPECIES: type II toxin-antitoxin system RelE/ParE family toxin [unclassified Sphingomonas]
MTYELGFLDSALKEWRKLDAQTRDQFKKKLAERLDHPHVPASKLSGAKDRYKIKLRNIGYRLVYEVHDTEVIVIVVAVGRRDRNAVYKAAEKRTDTAATVTTMTEAQQTPGDAGVSKHRSLTGKGRTLLDAASGRDDGDLDFEPSTLGDISRPADLD